RLNFTSGKWNGFGFFAEYDFILNIGPDDYNEGAGNTPDRVQYPVVADPEGADLNQAYVQWQSDGGTLLRGGRQRIIYDNARFVGNVGWRQNEQTYDGAYFQHKASGFDWQGAWVGGRRRPRTLETMCVTWE
ncbi:MAG: alginate export family protein, partial [Pelovirga sp.]